MSLFPKNKSAGFTLIELLVVISIIGLLSSIVLASLNGAREKARDTERKTNLKQLETALNMYFSDHGNYPSTGGSFYGYRTSDGCVSSELSGAGGYIPNLSPTYIPVLPFDGSIGFGGCDGYLYISESGSGYKLIWHHLDGAEALPGLGQPFNDPQRTRENHSWAMMICSGSDCSR